MSLRRYLRLESIRLELVTRPEPLEAETPLSEAHCRRVREGVLQELVELLCATDQIVNEKKLFSDLLNREKRASTAYGEGVALPHVRTLQARSFVMAFARSAPGIPFGAADGGLSHLFFCLVAPPYEDRTYLKVYRTLAPLLLDPKWRTELTAAQDPHRILRLLEVIRR